MNELVETVARAIAGVDKAEWALMVRYHDASLPRRRKKAIRAIAAINASRQWWVAPWEATPAMKEYGWFWDAMRTAFLAEKEEMT